MESRTSASAEVVWGAVDAALLVIVCVGAGLFLRRGQDAEGLATGLNRYVLDVALPALVLVAIPGLTPSRDLAIVGALPWLAFGVAGLLWWGMARFGGVPARTAGGLALVSGLGNTAFVGYPVVRALHGEAGLPVAVVIDQAGSFLVFATAGVAVALALSGERAEPRALLRRIVVFPPFVALLAALVAPRFGAGRDALELLSPALELVASTLAPVALVALGVRARLRPGLIFDPWVLGALALRMAVFPVATAVGLSALDVAPLVREVAVLQLGMPPMVTAGLLAAERGLDPDRALGAVGLGLPLCLVTVPLTQLLL